MGVALRKRVWRLLERSNLEISYDPVILFLGVSPLESRVSPLESRVSCYCPPTFTAALFAVAARQKEPKCPSVGEQLNKCATEDYSAIKGREL